jgi:uncharacterized protein YbjT (DUF2867 family)
MKIALLGAMGFVGQSAARELAGRTDVAELLLVDYNIREAKKFARALSPKCRWAMADVGRAPDLERILGDVDAVANAVGPCAEYEKRVFLTCARSKLPVASIGDGVLSGDDQREIHDAFRRAGAGAVSGCGLLPGWTDLLATHFLPAAVGKRSSREGGGTFLFCSPDRFGGYAFFRRIAREIGRPLAPPPRAPAGRYFEAGEGMAIGIPEGKTAGICRGIAGGFRVFGAVGREMSAAFLFWLRRSLRPAEETPAAAAGVGPAGEGHKGYAVIIDPDGRVAGKVLAETVLLLGRERGKGKGLLPLPGILGREEAARIASSCNATVTVEPPDRL